MMGSTTMLEAKDGKVDPNDCLENLESAYEMRYPTLKVEQVEQDERRVQATSDQDENDTTGAEIQHGSAVIRINESQRQCHLASILPSSEEGEDNTRRPIDFRVYYEAAGFLALQHFNERNPRVLPHLPELLQDCNIQLSMELRDSQFSPIYAAQHLQEILQRQHSPTTPDPIALVGAARSAVSQTLSVLAGVYDLPQISASSTSAALDNKATSPFFARTVPTNQGDAAATILYLQSLGVTHLGVLYIQDGFGTSFHSQILEQANLVGIKVFSTSFDASQASIASSIRQLSESNLRYFMGIFNPDTWKDVVRQAYNAGIIGTPNHVWLLSDASQELTQPGFRLNRETEADLAAAIDGTGVVLLNVESNAEFDEALSELETSTTLQEDFVAAHVEPTVFDGYTFPFPGPALYQYLNYDAVMALGVSACRVQQDFFTGPQLYETLLQTEFVGVSGLVRFSNETGTRDVNGLIYNIENVRIAENGTNEEFYMFYSVPAVQIDFANEPPVEITDTFVYSGGSTRTPPPLPLLNVNLNLISQGIRITGLLLGSLSMFCAVCWLLWTIYYRNIDVIRIAQPVFLCQLCVGAFIMAIAVIPMSMQEPTSQRRLDIACMATPWLLSLGFVTAFSALFSKTWRLNKLFRSGEGFRRVQVKARDVILPFVVLTFLNVTVLSIWTVVAPLTWTRRWIDNYDQFGRSIESYGTCYGGRNDVAQYVFMALIILINVAAILLSLYQSYQARNLPTDFNESYYIAVSTFSLLESMILGGPLLVLVRDNPSADFLIKSVLVTIVCATILLFTFIPKYLQRNIRQAMRRTGGTQRRKAAARIAGGMNRHSTFSSRPGRHSSASQFTSSVPQRSSVQMSSAESRNSTGTRVSFESPPPNLPGQSTIVRSEDYYLQRRSESQNRNKSSFFRWSSSAEQDAPAATTSPEPQHVPILSQSTFTNTTMSSSSGSRGRPSPHPRDGTTEEDSKPVSEMLLQLPLHDIKESVCSGVDRSTAESAEGGEMKATDGSHV